MTFKLRDASVSYHMPFPRAASPRKESANLIWSDFPLMPDAKKSHGLCVRAAMSIIPLYCFE